MDLLGYVISLLLVAVAFQAGETWIVIGTVLILAIASKDIKISLLLIISVFVLFYINNIGANDYWLPVMICFVAIGYLFGLGKEDEQAQTDPYAGLLGGGF